MSAKVAFCRWRNRSRTRWFLAPTLVAYLDLDLYLSYYETGKNPSTLPQIYTAHCFSVGAFGCPGLPHPAQSIQDGNVRIYPAAPRWYEKKLTQKVETLHGTRRSLDMRGTNCESNEGSRFGSLASRHQGSPRSLPLSSSTFFTLALLHTASTETMCDSG